MQYRNYSKSYSPQSVAKQVVAQQSKPPMKEKFVEHPETKSTMRLSKDGKWVIFKVTTTYFKPVSFLESQDEQQDAVVEDVR